MLVSDQIRSRGHDNVLVQAGTVLRVSGAQLGASAPQEALASAETSVLRLHCNGVHRQAWGPSVDFRI